MSLWDYFFYRFGIDEKIAVKMLLEKSDNQMVRELSAPQIYRFLLRDSLPKDMNTIELASLKSKYIDANKNFQKFMNDIRESLLNLNGLENDEIALLSEEELLNRLSRHLSTSSIIKILAKQDYLCFFP